MKLSLCNVMGLVAISLTIDAIVIGFPARSQIVPDASLPEPSAIVPSVVDAADLAIVGGTQVGSNLFHSFTEFNIQPAERVSFEAAPSVTDILARVTGSNVTTIEGTLSSGTNLFLLNPNGIRWGATAQANVLGALTLSAAKSVLFADDRRWLPTTPPDQQLLTVSSPIGLGLSDRGSLSVIGAIAVPPGQTLRLAGGNLALSSAQLSAPGGQLALVAGSGDWGFFTGFDPPDGRTGSIDAQSTIVSTAGEGGGRLVIAGDRVALGASSVLIADTLGEQSGAGLEVMATDFSVTGGSWLSSMTFGSGDAGDLRLVVDELTVTGLGYTTLQEVYVGGTLLGQLTPDVRLGGIFAGTAGSGHGGAVSIEAGQITFRDGGILLGSTFGGGAGSPIAIAAQEAVTLQGSSVSTLGAIGSNGTIGSVNLTAPRIELLDGGTIISTTYSSQPGGSIALEAPDILLRGTPAEAFIPGGILSNTIGASGPAGDVIIQTDRLRIEENTEIVAQSGAGLGDVVFDVGGPGGILRIEATDSINIQGGSPRLFESGISSATFSDSPAGNIELATAQLRMNGDAIISASTFGVGSGGTVTIAANDHLTLAQSAQITASAGSVIFPNAFPNATGTGGNIKLSTPELNLESGATVRVSSFTTGEAGTLTIASDQLSVDNATIEASSRIGAGGNITIASQDLRLRNSAAISTNSLSTHGGNIAIDTDTLIALENSDITANALAGFGGQVTINATGIFGTEFRTTLTPESDITATSALGSQFLGVVELKTPNVETTRGSLPTTNPNSTESIERIEQCSATTRQNTFVVTPQAESPNAMEQARIVMLPLVEPSTTLTENRDQPLQSIPEIRPEIRPIEATGWVRKADEVTLVDRAERPSVLRESDRSASCGQS